MTPIGSPSRISGTPIADRIPPHLGLVLLLILGVGKNIVDLRHSSRHGCTTDNCPRTGNNWCRLFDFEVFGIKAIARGESIDALVDPENGSYFSTAEPSCSIDHALQDWIEVELGAADDAQYLGRRGLLFQRLGKLVSALAQLVEQPRVS